MAIPLAGMHRGSLVRARVFQNLGLERADAVLLAGSTVRCDVRVLEESAIEGLSNAVGSARCLG